MAIVTHANATGICKRVPMTAAERVKEYNILQINTQLMTQYTPKYKIIMGYLSQKQITSNFPFLLQYIA